MNRHLPLLLISLLVLPTLAFGQQVVRTIFSTPYDVAIVYSILSKQPLDADELIFGDPKFQQLEDNKRAESYQSWKDAVDEKYRKIATSLPPLVVQIPVKVEVVKSLQSFKLTFPGGDLQEFPFKAGKKNIVIIASDLQNYKLLPHEYGISRRQEDEIGRGDTQVTLELAPISASPDPIVVNGVNKHILMTNVARIRLITQRGRIIWSYNNPKYEYLYGSSLNSLYGGTSAVKPAITTPP